MNKEAVITFIRATGTFLEQAHLRSLLDGEFPTLAIQQQVWADQRADGPFWASDDSSLDATCFRLAQAEQLGLTGHETACEAALTFLLRRQRADGSWEEEAQMAEQTPPWAKPGDLAARLYLTANCGFWLAVLTDSPLSSAAAQRAARALQPFVDATGQLPTFLHTHWLTAGLSCLQFPGIPHQHPSCQSSYMASLDLAACRRAIRRASD